MVLNTCAVQVHPTTKGKNVCSGVIAVDVAGDDALMLSYHFGNVDDTREYAEGFVLFFLSAKLVPGSSIEVYQTAYHEAIRELKLIKIFGVCGFLPTLICGLIVDLVNLFYHLRLQVFVQSQSDKSVDNCISRRIIACKEVPQAE